MLARLGNVLYWAGCLLAIPFLVFAGVLFYDNRQDIVAWAGSITIAVVLGLLGRACKYVLAGK
jgi:hypothetical protein